MGGADGQLGTATVAQNATGNTATVQGFCPGDKVVFVQNYVAGFPITCKNHGVGDCPKPDGYAVMDSKTAEFCGDDCRFEWHSIQKQKRQEAKRQQLAQIQPSLFQTT